MEKQKSKNRKPLKVTGRVSSGDENGPGTVPVPAPPVPVFGGVGGIFTRIPVSEAAAREAQARGAGKEKRSDAESAEKS